MGLDVEIKDGLIIVRAQFDKKNIELYKRINGRFDRSTKVWKFYDLWINHWCLSRIHPEYKPDLGFSGAKEFYEFPNYLMSHQRGALEIGYVFPRYALFDDTGTGKTLTGVELTKMHGVKTLCIAPWATLANAWVEDATKWRPELNVINLWELKNRGRNLETAIRNCDLAVINHEAIASLFELLISSGFKMLLLDESSKIKSPKAKRTKLIHGLASVMPYYYPLSGTPAPNNFLEYFTQVCVIDPLMWGLNFYKWRSSHFTSFGFNNTQFKPKKESQYKLINDLKTISRAVSKSDVLDLPERTERVWSIQLGKDELKAYNEMKRSLYAELFDPKGNLKAGISGKNAAVSIMKLRQITSGFIIDTDAGEWHKIGDSKLKALQEVLETIPNVQPIIWTQFIPEAKMIVEHLKKEGKTFGICNGTVSPKTKQESISGFKSGYLQYLIAHPRSIAHGVTLTNSTVSIYYSVSHSLEEQYQSQDRNYRKGQYQPVSILWLAASGTIDEKMLKCHKEKGNLQQEVLNYLKKR